MKGVGYYFIKNKNMMWSASLCLLAVILTIFILNTVLGLLVHYIDASQSIYWHSLSPYLVAVLLSLMGISIAIELYIFRSGGHSLAKQLCARRLSLIESKIGRASCRERV